jgi:Glycosyltransferase WbsX
VNELSRPGVGSGRGDSPHVLAFYLPQFHHVPENDAWHGHGFTEWNVVAASAPLYPGHRQPDLPGELGFYDLRVPEARYLQARLAREHGVTGFLYYHYWFGGRRMLERPFDEVLRSGQPDLPFALCWANESWYRRWQGSTDEMLVEQVFSPEDDVAHIRWLIECFKDPRYVRIEGRPLLTVYRAHLLPDPAATAGIWHRECTSAGVEAPWLVSFETGEEPSEPGLIGFDASAEFVPHQLEALIPEPVRFGPDHSHHLYDYEEVVSAYLNREPVPWRRYPCVATGWDNSPRRQSREARILHNTNPDAYGRWLAEAARRQQRAAGRDGIVFVNAWNEWAEGAHLEPDVQWGRAYLEKTREVLQGLFGFVPPSDLDEPVHPAAEPTEVLYHDLYERFVGLQREASGFLAYSDRRIRALKTYYEGKLDWARHQNNLIANMNEWLTEQLQLQTKRMNELALPGVASFDWLDDPPKVEPTERGEGGDREDPPVATRGRDEGVQQVPPRTAGEESQSEPDSSASERNGDGIRQLVGWDDQETERRDDGFDEQPLGRMPQWLVDVEGPE